MPPPKKNTTKAQTVFFGRETAVRREDVSKYATFAVLIQSSIVNDL